MERQIVGNIYTPQGWKKNHEIVFESGLIKSLRPSTAQSELYIIPGGVDLQVYGSGENLISAEPTSERIFRMEEDLLKKGTTTFLLCLATNTKEICIQAVESVKNSLGALKNCVGLHLEGPFLNPKKRGAHIERLIRRATLEEVREWMKVGEGLIKMITIAPECQDEAVIDFLLEQGVIVSIGHSDATFGQATAMYNKGVQTTTHLFNAMSPIHHRLPGIPTAVMQHSKAMASIIPDGIHVDFEIIKLAHRQMGRRLFLITDAVGACTEGPYQHRYDNGRFVMPDGTLSGSAISMLEGIKNCVNYCEISLEEAIEMATAIPSGLLKDESVGSLVVGKKANVMLLNKELDLVNVYFEGTLVD